MDKTKTSWRIKTLILCTISRKSRYQVDKCAKSDKAITWQTKSTTSNNDGYCHRNVKFLKREHALSMISIYMWCYSISRSLLYPSIIF